MNRALIARLAGPCSGILLAITQLYPLAAPLQALALLPALCTAACKTARLRDMLAAGFYMGLAYTLPQAVALQLPPLIMLVLIVDMTAIFMIFLAVSRQLLRGPVVLGPFAVGALLALLDWANFTLVPIWGTAQSLARPWSSYPGLILFTSFTGITGIILALGAMQALLARLVLRQARPAPLIIAVGAVTLALLTANVASARCKPVGTLTLAAVGWSSADSERLGGVDGRREFDALLAQPVAQAAASGARLVVFPEMAFFFGDWDREQCLEQFREVARRHRVFLAIGYFNISAQENRLLFMNPDGAVVAEYTKTHLTPFEDYREGDGRPVIIRVEGFDIGGMICQDDNFTDLSRRYGREGVAAVAVPTLDWKQVKDAHFQSSVHRAIESRYAVIRAASDGISAIISPRGEVLAQRDHFVEGAGAVVAEVPICIRPTLFSMLGHWPVVLSVAFLAVYVLTNALTGGFRTAAGARARP